MIYNIYGGGGGGGGGGGDGAVVRVSCGFVHVLGTKAAIQAPLRSHRTSLLPIPTPPPIFSLSHLLSLYTVTCHATNSRSTMPPLLLPNGAYWIPSRYFLMDGSSKAKKFFDIRQGNRAIGELYGILEDKAKAGGGGGGGGGGMVGGGGSGGRGVPSWRSALYKDEGLVLIAQIVLMSGCEALLASYSSNVAVLVHDLMLARKTSRGEPLHAMDINGRVYCGCGASFCMNLERKTVREGGRSIKRVVDGFKY